MSIPAHVLNILDEPDLIETICAHLAAGGSAIDLAKDWKMNYGHLMNWIRREPERERRYQQALNDRAEWAVERVLLEMRTIGLTNIQDVLNPDGTVKPINEWSESNGRAVQSLEVDELWDGFGKERRQIGITKKIKFLDKNRALELLGKNLALFVERVAISTHATLDELVMKSYGGSLESNDQQKAIEAIEAPQENSQSPEDQTKQFSPHENKEDKGTAS